MYRGRKEAQSKGETVLPSVKALIAAWLVKRRKSFVLQMMVFYFEVAVMTSLC